MSDKDNDQDTGQDVGQDAEQLEGRYANYFEVGHNASEFVLAFGQFYAGDRQTRIHTRIITAPVYAKALLETLRGSVDRYEKTFGIISKGDE